MLCLRTNTKNQVFGITRTYNIHKCNIGNSNEHYQTTNTANELGQFHDSYNNELNYKYIFFIILN